MSKNKYPNWQPRHEAVLKIMLEKPWLKQHEIALETGYSRSQISRIICSPEFKNRHRNIMSAHLLDICRSRFV